jgi:quinol monooxygenase YgiN
LQAFRPIAESEEPRRFVLYEVYEDEAAFDDHLVSSHYLGFTDLVESQIEGRIVRHPAFFMETATSDEIAA